MRPCSAGWPTIGIFLRRLEILISAHVPAFRRAMDERSYVNSVFHSADLHRRPSSPSCRGSPREYGIRSYKFYMSGVPGIVSSVSDDFLLEGFRQVAALGPDAVACVHCESGALVAAARDGQLRRTTPEGTLADWEKAHPGDRRGPGDPDRGLSGAGCAGAHLYVVHLSSRDGLEAVRRCRARRLSLHRRDDDLLPRPVERRPERFPGQDNPAGSPVRASRRAVGRAGQRRDQHGRHRQHVTLSRHQAARRAACGAQRPGGGGAGHASAGASPLWAAERSVPLDVLVERATSGPGEGLWHLSAQGHRVRSDRMATWSSSTSMPNASCRRRNLKGMSDFSHSRASGCAAGAGGQRSRQAKS